MVPLYFSAAEDGNISKAAERWISGWFVEWKEEGRRDWKKFWSGHKDSQSNPNFLMAKRDIAILDYTINSPVHETLALSVHWPPDPQRVNEGPCSWYPCGHVNKHLELIFISEVTQSFGEAFTGRLIIRARHFPWETENELKYCKDVRLVGVVYIYSFISK